MLSDLNIYSRHYMGFPILYGDMYYKAHTEIIDGQITSENKLIIHNVELGDKRRRALQPTVEICLVPAEG